MQRRTIMVRASLIVLLSLAALSVVASTEARQIPAAAKETLAPEPIQQAVKRSLPLLQKSLAEYPRHAACFSCHHQGVAMFALALAHTQGYPVETKRLVAVVAQTTTDLRSDLANYQKGQGQPGGVTRAGYALLALQSGGAKRDDITAAVTGFLLQRDKAQGFWQAASNRPPAEASNFTDTFLAVRALNAYGEEAQREAVTARIARARQWLEQTPPKDTEDRVFQMWGLKEAGAAKPVLQKATNALLAEQREDGGWAQRPGDSSDAYATGSVLTALSLAGGLSAGDAACQRGLGFLLQTQQPDGSWHVVSRSKPFQPYFESGFPHGKDQFISMAASSWATAALVLAGAVGDKTSSSK